MPQRERENTSHEGKGGGEKRGVKSKYKLHTVRCLGERKCLRGNEVIPVGMMSLMSVLLCSA